MKFFLRIFCMEIPDVVNLSLEIHLCIWAGTVHYDGGQTSWPIILLSLKAGLFVQLFQGMMKMSH